LILYCYIFYTCIRMHLYHFGKQNPDPQHCSCQHLIVL
jgi:hypothetical protein